MILPTFTPFAKIPRWNRNIVITEKIDGTNGTIYIDESLNIAAASRNRWITPGDDNYGFAAWVEANKNDLIKLGPGWHRGEWWGKGINRNYGLDHRRFSLFNTSLPQEKIPACCRVVPVLAETTGEFLNAMVGAYVEALRLVGSKAAPGFMRPEGIVIYHTAGGHYYKMTLDNDAQPKSINES